MSRLKSFDRVAHVYDETRGLPDEVERKIAGGIAALLHEVSEAPRLAEIGIGTGRIAVPLAGRGVHVTGTDISTKMLAVLRAKRADIDMVIAEASQAPFRERSFDASLFVHILHLVPDAEAAIRATMRLVRPGGVMIEAGDDREESLRSQADDLVRKTAKDLCRIEIGSWTPFTRGTQLFQRILGERGATVLQAPLARWTGSTTARRMLERLERRDYSSAWEIPETFMPDLLERVSPQVEELFGGLDTVIKYNRSFSMRYARLPLGIE
jgi:ubiquinone/menaquinone biosynthesis C-methylase UbiE